MPGELARVRSDDHRGQDRPRAGHERRAQHQAQAEARTVSRRAGCQARERALQDLHNLRNDHADAHGHKQYNARPADRGLRKVQQAQQRRPRNRDQHERGDQAGDDQQGATRDARRVVVGLACGDLGGAAALADVHAWRDAEEPGIDAVARVLRGRGRGGLCGIASPGGAEEEDGEDGKNARRNARDKTAKKTKQKEHRFTLLVKGGNARDVAPEGVKTLGLGWC